MPHPAHDQRGLTLLELLMSLSVISIIAVSTIPAMQRWSAQHAVIGIQNQMIGHLAFARQQAIIKGRRVVLCPSHDQTSCTTTPQWQHGWLVFEDSNADRERQVDEPLLRTTAIDGDSISLTTPTSRRRITYHPNGLAGGSNATIEICHRHREVEPRAIIIANTGRARASKRGPGGRPLRCPQSTH